MKKKSLLFLLALFVSLVANADVIWSFDSDTGTLTISGTGAMADYYNHGDAPWCTSYKDAITTVAIEDGVTHIGGRAFSDCTALATITIASSVTSIGSYAFSGCTSLPSITVPAAVTSFGEYTFCNCSSLTSITLPAGLTSIGLHCFERCSALTFINIPASVTKLEHYAFYNCLNLTSVICLCSTPPTLGYSVFDKCTQLATIYVPAESIEAYKGAQNWSDYVAKIHPTWSSGDCTVKLAGDGTLSVSGSGAMADYTISSKAPWDGYSSSITTVVIEDGVTNIGDAAVQGCMALVSVTLPAGLEIIGESAFEGCSALTSIEIPAGVTSIKKCTFNGCSMLASVTLSAGLKSIGEAAFLNCSDLTSIEFPAGLESIGESAFLYCSNLTSVNLLPTSVTNIGANAFDSCSKLASVTLSTSLESIGEGAFKSCSALTSIEIPASVTSIGNSTFYECSKLASVTLPAALESIGGSAFQGCSALASVILPAALKSIGESAFQSCALTSIEIPSSVTSIGRSAFQGCSELASVTFLAADVLDLGADVFDECNDNLAIYVPAGNVDDCQNNWNDYAAMIHPTWTSGACSVKLADDGTLTIFGTGAMADYYYGDAPWCTSYGNAITTVVIEDGVTHIGGRAFSSCSALTFITIASSVTSIGSYAFSGCTSLSSITVPANVTSFGEYTFCNCSSLTSIALPAHLTSIELHCFERCSALTSIEIPPSMTSIGHYAFYNCPNLTSVTCLRSTPPTLKYSVFDGCNANLVIRVPDVSESVYKSAENWSEYADKITGTPFSLKVSACGWASMYLPWAVTVPSGATAYYGSQANSGSVTLTPIAAGSVLPAETAVLVKATPGTYEFACTSTAADAVSNNVFEGVAVATTCAARTVYVLNASKTTTEQPVLSLYTGTSLGAYKTYLPKSAVPASESGSSTIRLTIGDATAIEIPAAPAAENADTDVIYNLCGQRVDKSHKGIVIVNGKKHFNH